AVAAVGPAQVAERAPGVAPDVEGHDLRLWPVVVGPVREGAPAPLERFPGPTCERGLLGDRRARQRELPAGSRRVFQKSKALPKGAVRPRRLTLRRELLAEPAARLSRS